MYHGLDGKIGLSISRKNREALFSLPNDVTIALVGKVLAGSPAPSMQLWIEIWYYIDQYTVPKWPVASYSSPAVVEAGKQGTIRIALTSATIASRFPNIQQGVYFVRGRMTLSNASGEKKYETPAQEFRLS